jgi:hypothetical protein
MQNLNRFHIASTVPAFAYRRILPTQNVVLCDFRSLWRTKELCNSSTSVDRPTRRSHRIAKLHRYKYVIGSIFYSSFTPGRIGIWHSPLQGSIAVRRYKLISKTYAKRMICDSLAPLVLSVAGGGPTDSRLAKVLSALGDEKTSVEMY